MAVSIMDLCMAKFSAATNLKPPEITLKSVNNVVIFLN